MTPPLAPVRGAASAADGTTWSHWGRHVLEMMLAMMLGMAMLAYPVGALAGALGYPDLNASLPVVATLVMALEMTVPMALWMGYRGHRRRGILEMSAVMIVPALVLASTAQAGITGTGGLLSTYHAVMLVSMLGLMLVRRSDYAGHA